MIPLLFLATLLGDGRWLEWGGPARDFHVSDAALRIGEYVYGSSGDFGPAPLTAVQVATGAVAGRIATFRRPTSSTPRER